MFLSAYHVDGDPDTLAPAYDRMLRTFPSEVHALRTPAGVTR